MKLSSLSQHIALFLVVLVFAAGCTNPAKYIKTTNEFGSDISVAENAVRIGYSAWPGWLPWQVSQQKKIFAENDAPVVLKWFDGYLESLNTLAAEQIDANSQTLGDTISTISGGADQVVVLVNDNSTGNDKVIVTKDINSIADLQGKKVAVEEGTVDHFLLLLGLEKEFLTQGDIELIPLETGKAAAAFAVGKVDATAVYAPFTTQALKRPGSKELFSSKDFPGAISDHLVFERKFVTNHPDQVQAVVNSWFATLDYIKDNPKEAEKIMAKRAAVSIEDYRSYNAGTKIFSVEENLEAFQPGTNLTSLQFSAGKLSDFLMNTNLIREKPDLSNLLDDRFVKAYAARSNSRYVPVRLGFSVWPGWLPWQVAQTDDIFEEREVTVDLRWFDPYGDSIDALVDSEIDANSQTLSDTIIAEEQGVDTVVVLVNDNSTGNDKVIVREGINSLADLQGKKVAVEEGTVDHYLLLLGLEKEGLTEDDIEFVPLDTEQAAEAFVAEKVDAAAVYAPFTTQAFQRPGSKELFSSQDFPGAILDLLVFDRQFVNKHPDRVQALVDAWFATLDYIKANPDRGQKVMAEQAEVTVEKYQNYQAGMTILSVEDNLKALQPGTDMRSLQFSVAKMRDFLLQTGLIEKKPDLSNLFDDRFVKAYAAKVRQRK